MNIIESWKQSFSLLAPKNFVPFVHDVINCIFKTYVTLFMSWQSIVMVLAVVFSYMLGRYLDFYVLLPWVGKTQSKYLYINQLSLFLSATVCFALFILLVCMAARSIEVTKNGPYFKRYFDNFMRYAMPFLSVAVVLAIIEWDQFFLPESCRVVTLLMPVTLVLRIAEPTLLLMSVFFFLDSEGGWYQAYKAVTRAGKMVLYNLPLFVLVAGLILSVGPLQAWIECSLIKDPIGLIFAIPLIWFLTSPLIVALGATLYAKIMHFQKTHG